ncbi:MAG: hypothetical protein HKN87_03855 [Saprospiraceae bacterium]|nr:hypothetical protein [Saprospiraceae bacterium]
MMKTLAVLFGVLCCLIGCKTDTSEQHFTFVSMPDFLNVDCEYPQTGWEDALSFILQSVKAEKPDFLTVSGDLVMGHWDDPSWENQDTIAKYADRYYSAWKQRMTDHELTYYTSIGDHELGDNPWKDSSKITAIPLYRKAFSHHLQMPQNGPEHLQGTAFWWRQKQVLFISVDVFEQGTSDQGAIKAGVTGQQLAWFEAVVKKNQDVNHIIVLGHTPILGPVRKWSSSGLMIEEGRDSDFWQMMIKSNVDLYLCGEVHAITCTERDGIMQIAHGGLIGYNTRTNYLVVHVSPNELTLELKEIEMSPHGEHLWQTKNNRPLQNVSISQNSKSQGFYTVGMAILDKGNTWKNRKGFFLPEHEFSSERATAIFRAKPDGSVKVNIDKIVADD